MTTDSHEVAPGVIDITHTYLDTEPDANFTDGARSYVRRALAEFLVPGSIHGVPGLSAACPSDDRGASDSRGRTFSTVSSWHPSRSPLPHPQTG
jgi:hypothetical protein